MWFISPSRREDSSAGARLRIDSDKAAAMDRAVRGPARLWRGRPTTAAARWWPPGPTSHRSLGPGCQAGRRGGVRPDPPPAAGRRGAAGRNGRGRDRRRAAGGPDDLAADPGGGAGGRPGRRRRPDRQHPTPRHRRGRPAPAGGPEDDQRPPLADRQDPAVEHRAAVHRHRDRRHLAPAGADRLRLRRLDQRGRRGRQGDLGHQPGAAQDDERGQPGRQPHRRGWPPPGRRASPAWTGPCASSPTRPARSAPSSRSSASAPPTSTSPSPRSPRWPTRPTCCRSTRRSRPRRPASTAWASWSSPARSAASPTRPPWPRWTSSAWSRRCSTASRPA